MFFILLVFVMFANFMVNALIDPIDLIKSHSYPAERHFAVTDDGYIITIHRISRGKHLNKTGPPVLLGHGTGSSSADFLNAGPERGLGYILADSGFDVWIGNSRGNSYSTNHIKYNSEREAKAFYNFR
ncbi:unnamed protein product [Brassicogethes aeneus]|uniref:Partial AB-hydrolase lipase domain-containing protein n=1 Tax=Brassicogethes aeneus TaxID=1431903 RepID=A0A9P0FFU2_BRAAE|nr:unnamed protein product [Brassicogethes aeneus]